MKNGKDKGIIAVLLASLIAISMVAVRRLKDRIVVNDDRRAGIR